MFGISFLEITVIFTILLLIFGPEKLPEMAKDLAKLLHKVKNTSDNAKKEIYNSLYEPIEDVKKDFDELKTELTNFDKEENRELRKKTNLKKVTTKTIIKDEEE